MFQFNHSGWLLRIQPCRITSVVILGHSEGFNLQIRDFLNKSNIPVMWKLLLWTVQRQRSQLDNVIQSNFSAKPKVLMAYLKHIPHLCMLGIWNCPTRKKPHAGMFLICENGVTSSYVNSALVTGRFLSWQESLKLASSQSGHFASSVTSASFTGVFCLTKKKSKVSQQSGQVSCFLCHFWICHGECSLMLPIQPTHSYAKA